MKPSPNPQVHVPTPLLEALKERFPDRLPTDICGATDIARKVGQQDVIRFLQRQHDLGVKT